MSRSYKNILFSSTAILCLTSSAFAGDKLFVDPAYAYASKDNKCYSAKRSLYDALAKKYPNVAVLASGRPDIKADFNRAFTLLGPGAVASVSNDGAKAFLYCECPNTLSSSLKTSASEVVSNSGSSCSNLALAGYGSVTHNLPPVTVVGNKTRNGTDTATNTDIVANIVVQARATAERGWGELSQKKQSVVDNFKSSCWDAGSSKYTGDELYNECLTYGNFDRNDKNKPHVAMKDAKNFNAWLNQNIFNGKYTQYRVVDDKWICSAIHNVSTVIKAELDAACLVAKNGGKPNTQLADNGSTPPGASHNTVVSTNNNAITKDCEKDKANIGVGEKCTELVKKYGQDYYVTREKVPNGGFKDVSEEHVTVDAKGNIKNPSNSSATTYTTANNEKIEKIGNKFYKEDGTEYKGSYNFTNSEGTTITKSSSGKIEKELYDDGTYVEYDKDGKPVAYKDSKGNAIPGGVEKKTDYALKDSKSKNKNEREDPCKLSTALNQSYKCRGTQTMIDVSNAQAQVTQLAGAAGVSLAGRNAVNQYQQSGSMSDAYKGAEKSFKSAKNAQIVTGVVNAAAFALLTGQKKKHQTNIAAINKGMCGSKKCTPEELERIANENRVKGTPTEFEETGKATVDAMNKKEAQKDGNRYAVLQGARDEQALMEGRTKERAAVHLIQGVTAIAQAARFAKEQKENAKLAARMANLEGKVATVFGNTYKVERDPADNSALTGTEGGTTDVTGQDPNGTGDGGLGKGLGLGAGGDETPMGGGGNKTFGNGGALAGGAGGGGGGVGGGAAVAPPDMNEGKAQPAEITEAKDRFEMGGGNIQASGGKSKGGNESGGLDLGNVLAQFLPKDDPAAGENGNGNGILSYEGAGQRGLASVEQNNYLDQKTDIFDRLSKKYHGLAEAKRLSAE